MHKRREPFITTALTHPLSARERERGAIFIRTLGKPRYKRHYRRDRGHFRKKVGAESTAGIAIVGADEPSVAGAMIRAGNTIFGAGVEFVRAGVPFVADAVVVAGAAIIAAEASFQQT